MRCGLLQALAEAVHAKQAPHEHALAEERKKKNYVEFWNVISLKDPFRLVLSEMRDRLFHTREILHHCLVHPKSANPLSFLVHMGAPSH
jgi:phosphoenolpyruvate carboxylase